MTSLLLTKIKHEPLINTYNNSSTTLLSLLQPQPQQSYTQANKLHNQKSQSHKLHKMEVEQDDNKVNTIQTNVQPTKQQSHKPQIRKSKPSAQTKKYTDEDLPNHVVIKRNRITDEHERNGYVHRKSFLITRSGVFYNDNLKQANIFAHIRPLIQYEDTHKNDTNIIHMDGIVKPPQIIFDCDNFVDAVDADKYASILTNLMSQDKSYTLYNIIPEQCTFSKISLTKLLIEFKENSLFEKNVKNLDKLSEILNDVLMYKAALVTTTIIPRKMIYKEFEVVLKNIDQNIRKDRLESIIKERVYQFFYNDLLLWTARMLLKNEFNIIKINLAKYYMQLSPNIKIDLDHFQLSQNDIKTGTDINQIKLWTKFILSLPVNPLIHHEYPDFLNVNKFNDLLSLMIPDDFVVNINRSYLNVLGNKSNISFQKASAPKTIVKLSINPVLILGGGINHITAPKFFIDGKLQSFEPYKTDIVQNYLNAHYPHCRKCLKWGTTTANCPDCKRQLNKNREKVKQDCIKKNTNIKQIRLLVGKVKVQSTCIRCSGNAHTYNVCSNKPFCKHDGLTHSPETNNNCELYKSIVKCFQNILLINHRIVNPLSLSIWQISTFWKMIHYHQK